MSDFFGALELELHAAANRRPRRRVTAGQALGVLAATALVAVAVAVVAAVSGGGDGDPARVTGGRVRVLVLATGTAPVTGRWQIEVSRTKGERDTEGAVMWKRGYCLWIKLLDPPDRHLRGPSGFCGAPRSLGFRKTPGFSRAQTAAPSKPLPKEILVWGRVPDRASKVVITAPGHSRIEVVPESGPKRFPGQYYAMPVKPPMKGARINWLDQNGKPGSRGIRLMPPITRR